MASLKFIGMMFSVIVGFGLVLKKPAKPLIPNICVDANNSTFSKAKGLLYNQKTPFSGILTDYYEDGALKSKQSYFEGKLQDSSWTWYPNGQLMYARYYEAGKREGLHHAWWENGQLQFEFYFEEDLHEGSAKEWYHNGQLYKYFHYSKGHETGSQKMWKPNGKIEANYVVKNGKRYGLTGLKNCKSVKNEK